MTTELEDKLDKRIAQYVAIRDRLKEMDDEHAARKAPLLEMKEQLTGYMLAVLDRVGGDNIKTKCGTCYATTKYTAALADPDAFMKFVIDNQSFHMLDRRANSTAVKDYVEKNGTQPPGVNLTGVRILNVRRK